jgi:hypothetical protein
LAYESKQSILEEAGFSHVVTGETLNGIANGSNTIFTANHIPLTDSNYDDTVDTTDVVVYVNGVSVAKTSLNVETGAITLTAAPANGATVTANYRYSPVTDQAVGQVQEEAGDLVDERLADIDHPATSATIRKIVRYYAAGLLLARDYGFQSDTEQTSKDGYKKMEMAEKWLEAYAVLLQSSQDLAEAGDVDLNMVEVETDPHLFSYYDRSAGAYASDSTASVDDDFMRETD